MESAFLFTAQLYKSTSRICGAPIILEACLITLDHFPLFLAETKLNQDAMLKVNTDSTKARYTVFMIFFPTLKLFSLLFLFRCWDFL